MYSVGLSPAGRLLPKRVVATPTNGQTPSTSIVANPTTGSAERADKTNVTSAAHTSAFPFLNEASNNDTLPSKSTTAPAESHNSAATVNGDNNAMAHAQVANSNASKSSVDPTSQPEKSPININEKSIGALDHNSKNHNGNLPRPQQRDMDSSMAAIPEDINNSTESNSTGPIDRVVAHQTECMESLQELVRSKYNVGSWIGLSTEQRKEVAILICKEHLFFPQDCETESVVTRVFWRATTSWSDYDCWVQCHKHTEPKLTAGYIYDTYYNVHFDRVGKLVEFTENTLKAEKQCSIM